MNAQFIFMQFQFHQNLSIQIPPTQTLSIQIPEWEQNWIDQFQKELAPALLYTQWRDVAAV